MSNRHFYFGTDGKCCWCQKMLGDSYIGVTRIGLFHRNCFIKAVDMRTTTFDTSSISIQEAARTLRNHTKKDSKNSKPGWLG